MADIKLELPGLYEREGGYTDAPTDRGGPTNKGITLATLQQYKNKTGYKGDIKDLPEFVADNIYTLFYWNKLRLDEVKDQALAGALFDVAVNEGVNFAGKILQRGLNALNRNQLSWLDLLLDGLVGPRTLDRINALNTPDTAHLRKLVFILRGARYIDIVTGDNTQEINIRSWLGRMTLK